MVRAPTCGVGGRRFESGHSPLISFAEIIFMSPNIEKSDYIASLPDELDRLTVEQLSDAFVVVMRDLGKTGGLLAVGGTVKPETFGTQRKDIDVLPVIDNEPDFGSFQRVVEAMTRQMNMKIVHITEPVIDPEYDSPSILKHDGSIDIQARHGQIINLIRPGNLRLTLAEALEERERRDYYHSLLAEV